MCERGIKENSKIAMLPTQKNQPLSDGQGLSSIRRCIICGSDRLSVTSSRSGFLWLDKFQVLSCANCKTRFKQNVNRNKWCLVGSGKQADKIWQENKGQCLTAREWVNIGNGGMSDEKQKGA